MLSNGTYLFYEMTATNRNFLCFLVPQYSPRIANDFFNFSRFPELPEFSTHAMATKRHKTPQNATKGHKLLSQVFGEELSGVLSGALFLQTPNPTPRPRRSVIVHLICNRFNYTKSNQTTTQPSLEAAHNAAAPPPVLWLLPFSRRRSSQLTPINHDPLHQLSPIQS
jgi:hypothetical protein